MKRKLTIRKYRGDDAFSWAVFDGKFPLPIISGLSIAEARSHKSSLELMYAERESV